MMMTQLERIQSLERKIHNQRIQIRWLEKLCYQRHPEGRWRKWFELAKKYYCELIWYKRAFDQ